MAAQSPSSLIDTIKKAITTQTRLELKITYSTGENIDVPFDPYLYGDDIMQNDFIWGLLTHSVRIYKFRIADIVSAKLSKDKFSVVNYACYYYAMEEEIWNVAPDFEKKEQIFADSHIGGPF